MLAPQTQQVITPPPDTDQTTTGTGTETGTGTGTQPDQPGPGTHDAQRRERVQREARTGKGSRNGLLVAALVAVVAIVAGAYALSGNSEPTAYQAVSNTDEAAAIQAEKQIVAAGREQVAGQDVARLPQDETATLQAEKEQAQARTHDTSGVVRDDSTTLAEEKAAQTDRSNEAIVTDDEATTLRDEKEQTLDRARNQDSVPSQADEAARLADEKAAIARAA